MFIFIHQIINWFWCFSMFCCCTVITMQKLMSLISGFGLTLCFLINHTTPHLQSVASAKYLSHYQLLGLLFCLLYLSDQTLNSKLFLLFFSCKIFSCLGFCISVSFNIAGPCNICCFFDKTCHFCGFDIQIWFGQIYHSRAPTC